MLETELITVDSKLNALEDLLAQEYQLLQELKDLLKKLDAVSNG